MTSSMPPAPAGASPLAPALPDAGFPAADLPAAVGVASLLFGLAHYAPGAGLVLLTDIGLIVIDSILYGVMFARRNNLWVVWLAHLLGDIGGLLVLAVV